MSISPYMHFKRDEWRHYRGETPLLLTEQELATLRGFNESVSIDEAEDIYLPLSRLLHLFVTETQSLHTTTNRFLHQNAPKVPYIIGVSGSVAVGKSTTSRILQTLLSRWPNHPKVELVSTDGFLYPGPILEAKGLMSRKGFPESYDRQALLQFLQDIKSGKSRLSVPVYSHAVYDVTGDLMHFDAPDIVIVEGLNILQTPELSATQRVYAFDFIDFNIFVDAPTAIIKSWFLERFRAFRAHAIGKPHLFFYQFAQLPEDSALAFADEVWETINAPNLEKNILPYKFRAELILQKGADHAIEHVFLKRV